MEEGRCSSSAGLFLDLLFDHPVLELFEFLPREEEGRQAVEEDSNPPAHQRPFKPEILRGGKQVDDDQQDVYSDIDSQMDVKSDFVIHAPSRSPVSLFVFHGPPLPEPDMKCPAPEPTVKTLFPIAN